MPSRLTASVAHAAAADYDAAMGPDPFPRHTLRKLANWDSFPLVALGAVQEIRGHIDDVQEAALSRALELGAGAEDIAEALGITRQGAYYKIHALEKRKHTETAGSDAPSEGTHATDVVVLPDATTRPQPS